MNIELELGGYWKVCLVFSQNNNFGQNFAIYEFCSKFLYHLI